jgi:hypothetical protein
MEHDCIARGLILATIDWPERARTYYFAHGGTINPEDGTLVPSDQIREIVARLIELIRMTAEKTFVHDRKRDELSAAIGTKEQGGCCRGKGAAPWKIVWRDQTPIKVTKGGPTTMTTKRVARLYNQNRGNNGANH